MKRCLKMVLSSAFALALGLGALPLAAGVALTAQPRYPWNGKVDIVIAFTGASNDVAETECTFFATNVATRVALPVAHVTVAGGIAAGTETGTWTRRFVWDSAADLGEVEIDDVALTVQPQIAPAYGCVQLWENGPYWAECNVGATKPEDYGYYFWWGDTVGYKRNASGNGWVSVQDGAPYSFDEENCPTYGKDNTSLQSLGYIDSTGNLVAAHDAATAHLGAPWRMPTSAEIDALISNCTRTWITTNGVSGLLVTGMGDYASKSIFLSTAGYGSGTNLNVKGERCHYWSSTPYSDYPDKAWRFYAIWVVANRKSAYSRFYGSSIRPLRESAPALDLGAATAHFALDTRTGTRANGGTTESIRFSPAWETAATGAVATVRVNGVAVTNATAGGVFAWTPAYNGTYAFTHTVSTNGVAVGETQNAAFVVTGLTPTVKLGVVAQRYPWNGLADVNYKVTLTTIPGRYRLKIRAEIAGVVKEATYFPDGVASGTGTVAFDLRAANASTGFTWTPPGLTSSRWRRTSGPRRASGPQASPAT